MKVEQMASIAIESITATAAYRWWIVIKNFGRVHASDIYDEDCPLHLGDLSILKMTGLVTIEEVDGQTFIADKINLVNLVNWCNLVRDRAENYPQTLDDTQLQILDIVNAYEGISYERLQEKVGSISLAMQGLLDRHLLIEENDVLRLSFSGREKHVPYDLKRVTRLNLLDGVRWNAR